MAKYILKRIGISLFVLLGISLIMYALLRLMPDSYVMQKFTLALQEGNLSQEDFDKIISIYGLDKSILFGYFGWLKNVSVGNLGQSFVYKMPVIDKIKETLPITFIMAFIATVLELIIAIPLGIMSAVKNNGVINYSVIILTLIGISLPSFFFSGILIKVFAFDLGWFDSGLGLSSNLPLSAGAFARFLDTAWHLVLPITVMVTLSLGGLMRQTKANMQEVLSSDYIKVARAKGLPERSVIYKHAFKNTAIPLVTSLSCLLPSLFCGSMVIERLFGIHGIGQTAYNALTQADIPFIMSYNMLLSFLTVFGILLADLVYISVDPRIRFEGLSSGI